MLSEFERFSLSLNQQKALQALLSSRTIREASASAGLGESTVRRYLTDPTFKAAYTSERARMLSEAIARLQQGAVDAAGVFIEELSSEDADTRIRAARSLLEFLYKGTELERGLELEELKDTVEQIKREIHEYSLAS